MSSVTDVDHSRDSDAESNVSESSDTHYEQKFEGQRRLGTLLSTAFEGVCQGTFAGMGVLKNFASPGLTVQGIGLIGLPLSDRDQKLLVGVAEMAPFGKGNELAMDTSVRKTYQIDADKVSFANPKWPAQLSTLLQNACRVIGVNAEHVSASLYKMLLYEPGGHFKRHRDTEKEPNHFATMILVLPSHHEGGSVTVNHSTRTLNFDLAKHTAFNAGFTVLYTDCEHAVEPVTSGTRLVLSYNLVYTQAHLYDIPRAPQTTGTLERLRKQLTQWRDRGLQGRNRVLLTHLLDHQYSQVGLSFNTVKGEDRAKVIWLKDAAAELNLSIYLAQVTITHVGMEDGDWETPSINFQAVTGLKGLEPHLQGLQMEPDDLTPVFDVEQESPDDEHEEEYQGNYPGDTTHKYFRSAVLLWPKEHDITVRVECAVSASKTLEKAQKSFGADPTDKTRDHLLKVTSAISYCKKSENYTGELIKSAVLLEDPSILRGILDRIWGFTNQSRMSTESWVLLFNKFGFASIKPLLTSYFGAVMKTGRRDKSARWYSYDERTAFKPVSPLEVAQGLLHHVQDDEGNTWLSEQLEVLPLADLDRTPKNAAAFKPHAEKLGFQHFKSAFLDNLALVPKDNDAAAFIIAIATQIASSPLLYDDASDWIKSVAEEQVQAYKPPSKFGDRYSTKDTDVNTVANLIKLCVHDTELIRRLLDKFQPPSSNRQANLKNIEPLILPLIQILQPSLLSEPYFSWIVKWKNSIPSRNTTVDYHLPTVGNAHVDTFLASGQKEHRLRATAPIRNSVENSLRDMRYQGQLTMSTERYGAPHTLVIIKTGVNKARDQQNATILSFYNKLGSTVLEKVRARIAQEKAALQTASVERAANVKRNREDEEGEQPPVKKSIVIVLDSD